MRSALRLLSPAPDRWMSAVSLAEAALVIEGRFGEPGGRELDALIARSRIELVAFDGEQAARARGDIPPLRPRTASGQPEL